eukprot:TRINITY_DN8696_c0_g1_i3.p1 TRINITY_DN8696_c0_g1~~TRINITY_DN8696_c0_g1_i3.p1  ORF type:complete len:735 (+),score=138.82 TRINITY_DN8696_c0_g1_i3:85-2289(+)
MLADSASYEHVPERSAGDSATSEFSDLREELQRESLQLRSQVSRYHRLLSDCQAIAAEAELHVERRASASSSPCQPRDARAAYDVELQRLDLESGSRGHSTAQRPLRDAAPTSPVRMVQVMPVAPLLQTAPAVRSQASAAPVPVVASLVTPRAVSPVAAPPAARWHVYPDSPGLAGPTSPWRQALSSPQATASPDAIAAAFVNARCRSASPVRGRPFYAAPRKTLARLASPTRAAVAVPGTAQASLWSAKEAALGPSYVWPAAGHSTQAVGSISSDATERLAQSLRKQAAKQLLSCLKSIRMRHLAAKFARWCRVTEEASHEITSAAMKKLATHEHLCSQFNRVGSILATAIATEGKYAAHHDRTLALLLGLRQLHTLAERRRSQELAEGLGALKALPPRVGTLPASPLRGCTRQEPEEAAPHDSLTHGEELAVSWTELAAANGLCSGRARAEVPAASQLDLLRKSSRLAPARAEAEELAVSWTDLAPTNGLSSSRAQAEVPAPSQLDLLRKSSSLASARAEAEELAVSWTDLAPTNGLSSSRAQAEAPAASQLELLRKSSSLASARAEAEELAVSWTDLAPTNGLSSSRAQAEAPAASQLELLRKSSSLASARAEAEELAVSWTDLASTNGLSQADLKQRRKPRHSWTSCARVVALPRLELKQRSWQYLGRISHLRMACPQADLKQRRKPRHSWTSCARVVALPRPELKQRRATQKLPWRWVRCCRPFPPCLR